VIAQGQEATDAIEAELQHFAEGLPGLMVVRNDVYLRFSHERYHKGSALSAIAERHGIGADATVAAGDHLNDLPMLARDRAAMLIAPGNAVEAVKERVRSQGGYVSTQTCGRGLARGLEAWMDRVLRP